MSDLAFLSATELAAKIAAKELSAVELLEMYLQRVDTYNPDLNAICVDIRDQAMEDAEAADAAYGAGGKGEEDDESEQEEDKVAVLFVQTL